MQFHEWQNVTNAPNVHSMQEVQIATTAYYNELRRYSGLSEQRIIEDTLYYCCETIWKSDRRPYYSVYPAITDALARTKLRIPFSALTIPHGLHALLVRFPKGHEFNGYIKSVLFTTHFALDENKNALIITAQHTNGLAELVTVFHTPDAVMEDVFASMKTTRLDTAAETKDIPSNKHTLARIVAGVCLLENDTELITPDVLNQDQHRLSEALIDPAKLERLTSRAHQRGKIGWVVGECTDESQSTEKAAHYRSAHWGFRWAGPNKCRLKWTRIRGCVVHREKLTTIPTGYLDEQAT